MNTLKEQARTRSTEEQGMTVEEMMSLAAVEVRDAARWSLGLAVIQGV